jgi:hypothetical protein
MEEPVGYKVDFVNVSTVGLESSPVVDALAGLRANEARYFHNKYKIDFIVEPAAEAKVLVDYVAEVMRERDIVIASKPLEATELIVDGIRWTYVFYESGLAVNVLYTLETAASALLASSFRWVWKSLRSLQQSSSLHARSRSSPAKFAAHSSS